MSHNQDDWVEFFPRRMCVTNNHREQKKKKKKFQINFWDSRLIKTSRADFKRFACLFIFNQRWARLKKCVSSVCSCDVRTVIQMVCVQRTGRRESSVQRSGSVQQYFDIKISGIGELAVTDVWVTAYQQSHIETGNVWHTCALSNNSGLFLLFNYNFWGHWLHFPEGKTKYEQCLLKKWV